MTSAKAAIVTGAGTRIGKFIAIFLSKNNFDIFLHHHNSYKEACETKNLIEEQNQQTCILHQCDLQDITNSYKLIDSAFNTFKHCCALINNASVFTHNTFHQTTIKELDKNMAINFQAPFFLSQRFYQQCHNRLQRGHIINILDSALNKNKLQQHFAYKMSKHALESLSETLNHILKPEVQVSHLYPDPILPLGKIEGNPKTDELCKKILDIVKKDIS